MKANIRSSNIVVWRYNELSCTLPPTCDPNKGSEYICSSSLAEMSVRSSLSSSSESNTGS